MVEQLARELVLPSVRLDVPSRPTGEQLEVLAAHSADDWTATPREVAHRAVVRLAVAALLSGVLASARPERRERLSITDDPAEVTLGQLAGLFRPHVALAQQAFALAVVDAVNAGVPAAVDPVREGLRRLGVTGREPVRLAALGLDKVPPRARGEFWEAAGHSPTVTAVLDRLLPAARVGASDAGHDVSGLDRSELSRVDAVAYGGSVVTPVRLTAAAASAAPAGRASWLHVPLSVGRPAEGPARRHVGPPVAEVSLRAPGWVEAFTDALDAVTLGMHALDLGNAPRTRGVSPVAQALGQRLAAAKARSVADVCAALREVGEVPLELFDHRVAATPAPVAVQALDDEAFRQLWLPTSATAGPLVTGAVDLFLGAGAEVRLQTGERSAKSGQTAKTARSAKPAKAGQAPKPADEAGGEPAGEGRRGGRSRRGRRSGRGSGEATPDSFTDPTPASPTTSEAPTMTDSADAPRPDQAGGRLPAPGEPVPAGKASPSAMPGSTSGATPDPSAPARAESPDSLTPTRTDGPKVDRGAPTPPATPAD